MKNTLKFSELGLIPELQSAIDDLGFDEATEIQTKAIPIMRDGADIIGKSQTGTGKTFAFAIPAIEKTDSYSKPYVQTIVLCPTRELVQQAAAEFRKLTSYIHGINVAEVYGGAPMDRQFSALKKANIVIGTPGRVMDHMRRGTLNLDNISLAVLDEADEMLSMGFIDDIVTILSETPESRQTVLFSATMPREILDLTERFQKDPVLIEINKKQVTLDNIAQKFVDVPSGRKTDALCLLLRYYSPKRAMIFCNTKQMVDEISLILEKHNFNAAGLHGDMLQSQRTRVMESFKSGKTNILVATDVAARGIDVNDLDYVFNYDIPNNKEYYVHRIGRTGRAGKDGVALTICSGRRQIITLLSIARSAKSELEEIDIPTVAEIREKAAGNAVMKAKEYINSPIAEIYRDMADELITSGYDTEDIISALLKMSVSDAAAGLSDIHSEKKNKVNLKSSYAGENYAKIKISIGRSGHVAPNFLVAAICDNTGISGKDVGKIEIYDDYSVVGVPESIRNQMTADLNGIKICGKTVDVSAFEYEEKRQKNKRSEAKKKPYASAKKTNAGKDRGQKRSSNKDKNNKTSTSLNRKSTHGKYSVKRDKKSR